MTKTLRVPCAYQGGKQRVAVQMADLLLEAAPSKNSYFYDLCCGSGAVSIELVNRGVDPKRIFMLDISSWGAFWSAIGTGSFDMKKFDKILSDLPDDKRQYKAHMATLSSRPVRQNEAELYPVLQACSFGGKQIWKSGKSWRNACFRNYWEPTATSVRRSPANPMQPSPGELRRRVETIALGMKGVTCLHMDIMEAMKTPLHNNAVVYVDPPYKSTTGYAFGFDLDIFLNRFREVSQAPLFISEAVPLSDEALLLEFGGAKGGISGSRKGRHQEWLTRF